MYLTRMIISLLLVVVLGGCMMMGEMGGMHNTGAMGGNGHMHAGHNNEGRFFAETRRGDLKLTLSFPAPQIDAPVPIEARLYPESGREVKDVSVRLLIETPGGSMDQVRMLQAEPSAAETYQAQYNFRSGGTYRVTADGRIKKGAEADTISVSIETVCTTGTHDEQHDWLHAAGLMGGAGMILFFAAMHAW